MFEKFIVRFVLPLFLIFPVLQGIDELQENPAPPASVCASNDHGCGLDPDG